jgi:hypothetical protein
MRTESASVPISIRIDMNGRAVPKAHKRTAFCFPVGNYFSPISSRDLAVFVQPYWL